MNVIDVVTDDLSSKLDQNSMLGGDIGETTWDE